MTDLEAKIKCKECQETFVFFEDLEGHFFTHFPIHANYTRWLKEQDEKVEIFVSVVKESLTVGKESEIID